MPKICTADHRHSRPNWQACDNPLSIFVETSIQHIHGESHRSSFFASIGLTDSTRIAYMFIQVPEGKTVKNRVHLDLDADDVESEVTRAIALGATRIHEKDEFGMHWTTLADPEGNEFCIGSPHH